MRCDETNRKMKMMVVLCFFFQARRYGASFRGYFFHSCVRYRWAEASLSSSWRCGLVEVLSFDFGQCIYHTIPYRTSLMFFVFVPVTTSMRPSSLMGVWCST